MQFLIIFHLFRTMMQSLNKRLKRHKCVYCLFTFSTEAHLRSHSQEVHKGLKPYKCEYCWSTFSRKANLVRHRQAVHLGLKPYKCVSCSSTFSLKWHLVSHCQAVHLGLKPYKCDSCSSTFSEKSNLVRHCQAVHQGLKPYKCDSCSSTFSLKKSLVSHCRAVHLGLKPYKCDSCSATFSRKGSLSSHWLSVHNVLIRPSEEQLLKGCSATTHESNRNPIVIKKFTESKKKYTCAHCEVVIDRYTMVMNHILETHVRLSPESKIVLMKEPGTTCIKTEPIQGDATVIEKTSKFLDTYYYVGSGACDRRESLFTPIIVNSPIYGSIPFASRRAGISIRTL